MWHTFCIGMLEEERTFSRERLTLTLKTSSAKDKRFQSYQHRWSIGDGSMKKIQGNGRNESSTSCGDAGGPKDVAKVLHFVVALIWLSTE